MKMPDRLDVLLFALRNIVAAVLFLLSYGVVVALGLDAGQLEILVALTWAVSFAPFITTGVQRGRRRDNLSRPDGLR